MMDVLADEVAGIDENADVLLSDVLDLDEMPDYEYPSYDDKATVLVRAESSDSKFWPWEVEILDEDGGRVTELIHEGIGWEHFFCWYVELPAPGVYVVKGIEGEYYRGDGWEVDDDEAYWCEEVRPATLRERVLGRLD